MLSLLALAAFASNLVVPPPVLAASPGSPAQVQAVPERPWPPDGILRAGSDKSLVMPKVIKESKPLYTREARKEKIAGTVMLEAVVEADGTVGEVRVKKSLDSEFGLDDEAVRALKKWQFTPGKKDGVAVPVLVEVEMTFTVR